MPMEMAQCARDKLQASAREIWSSIRSFDASARKEGDDAPQSTASAPTMSLERIEHMLKVMFGSCATGMPHSSPEAEPAPSTRPVERRSRSARSRDFMTGEHVYAQLFMDDQARATRAVNGLRERAASSPRSRRRKEQVPLSTTAGFAAGSPVPVALPTAKAVDASDDFSFDDGISAISASTLEEMARIHDHKTTFYSKSKLKVDHSIIMVETISHPHSNRSGSEEPIPSLVKASTDPLKFTRGRSNGTTGTKSTKSSHGSEFANTWKEEERKYWDCVVQQDQRAEKNSAMTRHTTQVFNSKARRRSRGSVSVSAVQPH